MAVAQEVVVLEVLGALMVAHDPVAGLLLPEVHTVVAAVAVLNEALGMVVRELMAQFVLSGPAILVPSHQPIQGIYK